jgi:hypothetical protein
LQVDLGMINGHTFVNNASFGAYAEVVETPAYRGDKLNTTLNTLPDLLQGHRGARLRARADGKEIEDADDKRRARLNIISHLLSQVPYKPLPHRDITLPKRQPRGGYRQPDLPWRRIQAPF